MDSVSVGVGLVRPGDLRSDVVSLLPAQLSQFCSECGEVQPGNFLVKLFREQVDLVLVPLVLLPVLEEVELSQYLVRKRARHNERRVARGAAKVEQPPRCQDDHAMAIGENE